ncbi:MAG: Phenylalanyl-tRNA synthetase beta chain [uncultured Propionibacteriaceae bacterium]|uniref:Phenylalanine--tRNA ligase beta subunit n=1 Tax=uncultured Propionibacteriaceae bacterium TaxID=257457 RepID=A0A6J4NA69_9ACTN|nr:MAG: Phenylalanyl-tRNA synthetase beta chain [uncultured Propionibacteriaceae bacterium]
MRAPLSWLRDYAALPEGLTGHDLGQALIRAGLEVETVESAGSDVTGPLVVGRVVQFDAEPQKNGKTIRWCRVDVGPEHNDESGARGIVCGADNFAVNDLVVVALPGAVLPGNFAIAARRTYGHVSDGMICSAKELGLGDDQGGILVLTDDDLAPGMSAYEVLHLRDDVLDIAVTPDRGYCWSLRGLAREAAQALDVAFGDPVELPVPAQSAAGYPVRLESAACPLFVAVTVTGVDSTRPSPRWMQRRIQLAGMRPISLTVDITNYVMLETGQPIHAYDADRLNGAIVVRQARLGEKIVTLDDVIRDLDSEDLLITDDSGPIGLAGVMGGASTELSGNTSTVVIEAAHFDALTIARTSRRHKLSSEASKRFERGVDAAATYAAAHRVARLLEQLAGGTVDEAESVVGAVPEVPAQRIDAALPSRILGLEVPTDKVVELLEAVGVQLSRDGERLLLVPPTWRPDLRDPYDYVEEVGRLIGLENIPPVVPNAPAGRGLAKSQRLRRAVNHAVAAAGFVEVLSFPFVARGDLDQLQIPADDERAQLVRLANPLSETSPYLRTTLLPGLLAAVTRNTSRSNDDLALFEAGLVFLENKEKRAAPRPSVAQRPTDEELAAINTALPRQPRHLATVLTGNWLPARAFAPAEPATWGHAVVFVEAAARAVGLSVVRRAGQHAPWHPGRCAEILIAGTQTVIGYAGELHPSVCKASGVPARTCAAEIDLDALIGAAPDGGDVADLSTFPVAKEDVALIVDDVVPAEDVRRSLVAGAGPLLESVRLFDVYVGEQIGIGKKSLAFALRFRASDRTLTDAEAAAARDAAVAAAAEATGAVQRTE